MWTTYASLRIFVLDRLAFTTFLIKELESQTKASSVAVLKPTTDLDGQAQKAFELIQQLSTMVTANGAELIVIPDWRDNSDVNYNRNKKIKILSELIGKNLGGVFYIDNIASLVDKKIALDGKQLSEMRFRNDHHLSSYGHQIISQVLLNIFQDLTSIDK